MNFAIKYLPFELQPYFEVTWDLSKKLQTEFPYAFLSASIANICIKQETKS